MHLFIDALIISLGITSYGDLFDRLNTGYRMEQPKYANSQL